jgi:hypothetical protein
MYATVPIVVPVLVRPVCPDSLAMPKSRSLTRAVSSPIRAVPVRSERESSRVRAPDREPGKDIRRFDVAMDDAGVVRRSDAARDLDDDVERLGNGQRATLDALLERLAFVMRHREKHATVRRLIDLVDGADVGMIECGSGLRLDDQAPFRFRIL